MLEQLAPLDQRPVSVHAPFVSYPGGQYRHEDPDERHAVLLAALDGVALGTYDQRIVGWLARWDVPTVATVVSLLLRARHAGAQHTHRGGGEPR